MCTGRPTGWWPCKPRFATTPPLAKHLHERWSKNSGICGGGFRLSEGNNEYTGTVNTTVRLVRPRGNTTSSRSCNANQRLLERHGVRHKRQLPGDPTAHRHAESGYRIKSQRSDQRDSELRACPTHARQKQSQGRQIPEEAWGRALVTRCSVQELHVKAMPKTTDNIRSVSGKRGFAWYPLIFVSTRGAVQFSVADIWKPRLSL